MLTHFYISMIDLLLLLALFVWPLGQLLVIPIAGINVATLDIIAALIAFFLIVNHQTRRRILNDPLFWPIAVFDFVSLITLILNPTGVAFAYWLRFVVYGAIYFAVKFSKTNWRRWLTLSGGVFIVTGFVQYLFLPDMRFLYYLGFDDHLYRLVGALLDPNYTGLLMALLTLVSLAYFQGRAKLVSLIPLLALALTFSRASYLTLVVALIFLALRQKKYVLIGAVFVLGLFVYLVPKPFGEGVNLFRTFSIQSRLTNQTNAYMLFSQKPLLGQGFGSFKSQQGLQRQFGIPVRTGGVDNSFLFVLATTGVVGVISFIFLLRSVGRSIWPSDLGSALVFAILFHSLFNNSFFYSWILAAFWMITAFSSTYRSDMSTEHKGKGKVQKHGAKA